MKRVQVSPGQYVSVSPQAQERARKAFARVAFTQAQAQQIAQATEAVAQVNVLVGSRTKLYAMASQRVLTT